MMSATNRFANCSISQCHRPSHYLKFFVFLQISEEEYRQLGENEVSELHQRLNVAELLKRASTLNGGQKCRYESRDSDTTGFIVGCANFHGRIIFDDQTEWLIRIPRKGFNEYPRQLIEHVIASEFATLKFLENTQVPAPKAYDFGLASDKDKRIGVDYILMERIAGRPWDYGDKDKQSVLESVADILIELSKYPFAQAGSLVIEQGDICISKMASNRYVHLDAHGPYATDKECLLDVCQQYLDLIADGQICPRWPQEAFAFYSIFATHVEQVFNGTEAQEFFLKHVDDKGDHILLDETGRVTGIIDWQFAQCVPAAEAFGPSYVTADQARLQSADAGLTEDDQRLANILRDKGSASLGMMMERDELLRRFRNGISDLDSKEEAQHILRGLLAVMGRPQPEDIVVWALEVCRQDHRWPSLLSLSG
ncbi:hypothetical protein D6C79_06037 [Aureobasidium pullulans]|nr:hypothetical protein D6C79_06037 [Aureobasidium pullulans]